LRFWAFLAKNRKNFYKKWNFLEKNAGVPFPNI
jgi:hypothetical protein